VKAVKDLARLRKYSEEGKLEAITNCEDNTRSNYAADYLPDYVELREELINTYQLAERRRGEMNKKSGKKGHPSFPIMDGHAQPGVGQMRCFGCGVAGHRAGDPACKAKEGEVHKDAPEWFRKQSGAPQRGGKGKGKGKGKSKGKGRGGDRKAKPLCQNWSKGNGYCRYAAACNFSHDGPQGGGKRKWKENSTSMPAKAIKRAKKEIMSMVVEAMAEQEDDGKSAARSASEKLLELCRGAKKKSVGMIGCNLISPDFVPSPPKPTLKSVLMLPGRGMSVQEYKPVNRSRVHDASEAKAGDEGEERKKNGENPISLANAMSEKVYDEENLEKVNDARQKSDRNDVEINGSPDQILCGPQGSTAKEFGKEIDLAGDVGESVEGWET
jgi:hypothetical protein